MPSVPVHTHKRSYGVSQDVERLQMLTIIVSLAPTGASLLVELDYRSGKRSSGRRIKRFVTSLHRLTVDQDTSVTAGPIVKIRSKTQRLAYCKLGITSRDVRFRLSSSRCHFALLLFVVVVPSHLLL